jgi:kinesin family protein 11
MEGTIETDEDKQINAGIVPRTLYRLFDILEAEKAEYSVRVSYLELYNEELKDLLSDVDPRKLRLYEDASRKGVIIHGIEEVLVKTADDVIDILQTGSNKRRIAATNFNEKSRYSVFQLHKKQF